MQGINGNLHPSSANPDSIGLNSVVEPLCGPPCGARIHRLAWVGKVERMTTVSTGLRLGVGMIFVSMDDNAVLSSSVSVGSCITRQSTENVAEIVPSKTWGGALGALRTQTTLSWSSVVKSVQLQF